ncbi:MAG: type IX secretion system membrane protein PorP/SprF [Cyclobacteriaceae bacterium]|nr:type IX secretion system membrane protein PorP/SprF [Cyclobacteriaceae bacterium SS2]
MNNLLFRRIKVLFFLLFLVASFAGLSQQPLVYNQFFMNPYVYNPAYAGVEGHSVLFLMYKNQYSNIDGAPKTYHANFHVPLKGGLAFGASAYNESHGVLNTVSGKVTGGYLLSIDREHFIRFGLSIGAGNNSINVSEFDSPNDPAFTDIVNNSSFLVGDFGLTYHFNHFNVGFAMPSLFGYQVFTENSFSPITIKAHENVLLKMNYRGHITDNLAFEPHIIYRYNKVLPDQYEGTLIVHLAHIIWLGGTYRQDAGVIGLLGAKIKESLAVGVAYEVGNFNYTNQLGPSYEVHVGYHIGAKKDHAEHVSSFIKSHRLSAEERAEKAELERQRRLQALEDARNQQSQSDELTILQTADETQKPPTTTQPTTTEPETTEPATTEPVETKEPVANTTPTTDTQTTNQNQGTGQQTDIREPQIEDPRTQDPIRDQVTQTTAPPNQAEIERGDPELTQDFRTPSELAKSDQHMEVRRGGHMLELPAGTYVVAGVFEFFENAEEFSDRLFNRGFHDVKVGYLTARGYYYVVIFQSNNLTPANTEKQRVRRMSGLSDVWVLKVNE